MKRYKSRLKEEVDVQKVIGDFINTKWSQDPNEKGKVISMLKGLIYSDDSKAQKFIKDLDDASSKMNFEDYK